MQTNRGLHGFEERNSSNGLANNALDTMNGRKVSHKKPCIEYPWSYGDSGQFTENTKSWGHSVGETQVHIVRVSLAFRENQKKVRSQGKKSWHYE